MTRRAAMAAALLPLMPDIRTQHQHAHTPWLRVYRAWYDRLKIFLLAQGFKMGCVDKTLFLMRSGTDFLLVQIYVDDIIFGGSSHALVSKFSEQMSRELR